MCSPNFSDTAAISTKASAAARYAILASSYLVGSKWPTMSGAAMLQQIRREVPDSIVFNTCAVISFVRMAGCK